jgi:hypothetical protein
MWTELTGEEVAALVEECFGGSPLPQLQDEASRRRARETAAEQGVLERIAKELAADGPIPVLPYTRFRDYQRSGNRTRFEALQRWRGEQIELVTMACLFGVESPAGAGRSSLDYLHDLLWAECEATWWVMPAHERGGTPIDLRVALAACKYATILTLLRDRIVPEVRQRVLDEIRRRVLRPYLAAEHRHGWKTSTNNWNAVCLANVCIAAMLVETEAPRLGRLIADALEHLPSFLSGFAPDGGCTEGPSYWRFGFGWFIRLAAAVHDYTGGRIDLAAGERIGRMARYPLSVALAPGQELTFADAHGGCQDPVTVMLINRFHDVPELFSLCELREDGRLACRTLEALLLYDGRAWPAFADASDHFLAELGVALVRAGGTSLGAKAGHNAEHHNHNDVGSFLAFRDGCCYLSDPGAPVYSARTFSPRRYESIFCNSLGHSVPVVNGRQQSPGQRFGGTIAVEGLNAGGDKTLTIEMAGAYDVESLRGLRREIELAADGAEVRLADTFAFADAPQALEEAFITTHPVTVAGDGGSATIQPQGAPPATLAALGTAGRFAVAELIEESRAEARSGEVIRRITFTPDALGKEMALRFALRLGA